MEENQESQELIELKTIRKEFINKILIFGTLAIVVIFASSMAGIIFAQSYNEGKIKEYYSSLQQNIKNLEEKKEENSQEEQEREEVKKNTLLPVYSENAKNRISNIYKEESEEKKAYLTFDDGPSSKITPQILQILAEENIRATFFVLGSRVELYPELVKQEYEAGHYIANHGYSHDYSSIYSSVNAVLDEYNRTENLIKEAIGNREYSSYLFRFPGGSEGGRYKDVKDQAKALLEENNVAYINWNSLTNDAVGHPTAESIVNDLKASVDGKKNVVILMHDAGTKQLTADTLRENISYLKEQGYTFRTFYDIMCE